MSDRFWPRPKTLLVQHFCLHQAKNVFELFQKHHVTNFASFACQAMFMGVAKRQTFVVKQIQNVGPTTFDRLARS